MSVAALMCLVDGFVDADLTNGVTDFGLGALASDPLQAFPIFLFALSAESCGFLFGVEHSLLMWSGDIHG